MSRKFIIYDKNIETTKLAKLLSIEIDPGSILAFILAHNNVLSFEKNIFSFEIVKNDICLVGASK